MKFNFFKLRSKIIAEYGSLKKFALEYGISYVMLSKKLNNKAKFTTVDIVKFCEMLNIVPEEIGAYFFTPLV